MFKNLVNRESFISKLLKYNICINSLFYINSAEREINNINSNIYKKNDNYIYTGNDINDKTIYGINEYNKSVKFKRIRKKIKITKPQNNKNKLDITLGNISSYDDDSFNSNISFSNDISSINKKTHHNTKDIDEIFGDDISIIEKKNMMTILLMI